jgi:hypothetical protein
VRHWFVTLLKSDATVSQTTQHIPQKILWEVFVVLDTTLFELILFSVVERHVGVYGVVQIAALTEFEIESVSASVHHESVSFETYEMSTASFFGSAFFH